MEANDKKFVKGFNHGYFLAQHYPKTLSKLLESKNNHDYIKALSAGKEAYEQQQLKRRSRELGQQESRDLEQER